MLQLVAVLLSALLFVSVQTILRWQSFNSSLFVLWFVAGLEHKSGSQLGCRISLPGFTSDGLTRDPQSRRTNGRLFVVALE
jgi:hypothetical protein